MNKLINLKGYYDEEDENFVPLLDSENSIVGSINSAVFAELEQIPLPTWNIYAHNLVHHYSISEDAFTKNLEFIAKIGAPNYFGLIYSECQKLIIGHSLYYEEDSLELALNSYLRTFLNRLELRVKSLGLKEVNMFDDKTRTEYTNTLNLISNSNQETTTFSLTEDEIEGQSLSHSADNTFTIENTPVEEIAESEPIALDGITQEITESTETIESIKSDQAQGLREGAIKLFGETTEVNGLNDGSPLNDSEDTENLFRKLQKVTSAEPHEDSEGVSEPTNNVNESDDFPNIDIIAPRAESTVVEDLFPNISEENVGISVEHVQSQEVASTIDFVAEPHASSTGDDLSNGNIPSDLEEGLLQSNEVEEDTETSDKVGVEQNDDSEVLTSTDDEPTFEDDLSLDGLTFKSVENISDIHDNANEGDVGTESEDAITTESPNSNVVSSEGDTISLTEDSMDDSDRGDLAEVESDTNLPINDGEFEQPENETFKLDEENKVINSGAYVRRTFATNESTDVIEKTKEAYQPLESEKTEEQNSSVTDNIVPETITQQVSIETENRFTQKDLDTLDDKIMELQKEMDDLKKSKKEMENIFLTKLKAKDEEILRLNEQLKTSATSQLYQMYEKQNDARVSNETIQPKTIEVVINENELGKKIDVGFKEIVSLTDKHFTEINTETSHYVYNPLKR